MSCAQIWSLYSNCKLLYSECEWDLIILDILILNYKFVNLLESTINNYLRIQMTNMISYTQNNLAFDYVFLSQQLLEFTLNIFAYGYLPPPPTLI